VCFPYLQVKEFSTHNGASVLANKMREILLELTILVRQWAVV